MMFSSVSFAAWTKVHTTEYSTVIFVDYDSIRKSKGFAYYWKLENFAKRNAYGNSSFDEYLKVDCRNFTQTSIFATLWTLPNGNGTGNPHITNPTFFEKATYWSTTEPNSLDRFILNSVCK